MAVITPSRLTYDKGCNHSLTHWRIMRLRQWHETVRPTRYRERWFSRNCFRGRPRRFRWPVALGNIGCLSCQQRQQMVAPHSSRHHHSMRVAVRFGGSFVLISNRPATVPVSIRAYEANCHHHLGCWLRQLRSRSVCRRGISLLANAALCGLRAAH